MLRYTTDRARPGLVALYDIRPGNGAGQFLQPRSPHGAVGRQEEYLACKNWFRYSVGNNLTTARSSGCHHLHRP